MLAPNGGYFAPLVYTLLIWLTRARPGQPAVRDGSRKTSGQEVVSAARKVHVAADQGRAAFDLLVVVAESRGTVTAFALACAYSVIYFGNPVLWQSWPILALLAM
jgi:hypothetical protein